MTHHTAGERAKWDKSRTKAIAEGHKMYIGKPCIHHGNAWRLVSNYMCVECRKVAIRKKKKKQYISPKGPAIFEKIRKEKPEWPLCNFRDNVTPPPIDSIPYSASYHTPLRRGSSAASVADS